MYFDAHSDILNDVTRRRLNGERGVLSRCHLPRLKKGGVEGSLFVIWVDPPYDRDYAARTRQIVSCTQAEAAECNEVRIVHNTAERNAAIQDGKFYIYLGIEGLSALGEDLSGIDRYYDFGCRHAMLTWNEANALGCGAKSGSDAGLTPLGKEAVKKIQEKHMLLDTSHLNEAGFWDIVDLATAPITASHSNCRSLCDLPRCLSDDQLRAIRDLDGVVGLNSFFVSTDPEKQTVETLAKHADHMINVMGIEHVGCGFDFCEFFTPEANAAMAESTPNDAPRDMQDASQIPNLFAVFQKMGLSKEEQDLIGRRNFQRLLTQVIG